MAEFEDVMKQKNRMCEAYRENICGGCPLYGKCYVTIKEDIATHEKIIMDWAKENPAITNKDKLYQIVKEAFDEEILQKIKENIERGNRCLFKKCECVEACDDCKNNGFWDRPYIAPKGE